MEVLNKQGIGLDYDPAIPLLGIYLKEIKNIILKDTCKGMFIAALLSFPRYGSNLSVHQQMKG